MSLKNSLEETEPYITYEAANGKFVTEFDEELALAHLLMNSVLIVNEWWWKEDWPPEAQKSFALAVNTNDIFCYGADAVPLNYDELEDLYTHWYQDPVWGYTVWAAKKLNLMPLKRITDRIEAAGIWNLSLYNLAPNKW